jgi:hypothetical protein
MKRVLVLCLAGVLVACGSDDDDGGGGGGGGGSVTLTGPLAANIASSAALSFAGGCTQQGIPVSSAVVGVAFSSAAVNACQYLQQSREPANSTTAFLTVARVTVVGQAAVTPGTYTVRSDPVVDPQGNATLARVDVTRSSGPSSTPGEGCEDTGETEHASGTITLTSVTGSAVAGSLDVTLRDGGRISGTFDVPTCALPGGIDPTTCEPTALSGPTTCQ